ncbi:alpha/beta hydrolase [Pseudovibrio sp. SPO723]|uniref:alpha/beta fold hydrolase n=1 Tax=Nesiotobacter zosterae TaxID=392721 RepID=UPI0029C1DAC5|nr:alpha/beta hydrolase [Pseudovibrio sp. SPO723]MDX5595691.1 alpha/beta hydrolase [Pseudovibrio sp. SPO723]
MQVSNVFRRDGFEFSVKSEGTGPNLLVIGSSAYYDRVFSRSLRSTFRLHLVDHRGFAPSSRPVTLEDAALEVISADIDWLRAELGLEHTFVLGHSGHGYMALDYARRYPGPVQGLVLAGLSPDLGPSHQAEAETRFAAEASEERKAQFGKDIAQLGAMIESDPARKFAHICCALQARRWADPTFDESWLWEGLTMHTPLFDALWGDVFANFDMADAAGQITFPVLLVMGKKDFSVAPTRCWEPVSDRFADLTIKELAESGHTPMLEQPAEFDQLLADWARSTST